MGHYSLRVFHPGADAPTEVVYCASATEVLATIPAVLDKHRDCRIVEVHAGPAKLFAVDCTGATVST
jgi:hypothetical protein